jgi:hypothetical protein
MYQYNVLYLAWCWLNEPKHVVKFLIINIDYPTYVVFIDCLNYYNTINVLTVTESATDTFSASSRLQLKLYYYFNLSPYYCFSLGLWLDIYGYFKS